MRRDHGWLALLPPDFLFLELAREGLAAATSWVSASRTRAPPVAASLLPSVSGALLDERPCVGATAMQRRCNQTCMRINARMSEDPSSLQQAATHSKHTTPKHAHTCRNEHQTRIQRGSSKGQSNLQVRGLNRNAQWITLTPPPSPAPSPLQPLRVGRKLQHVIGATARTRTLVPPQHLSGITLLPPLRSCCPLV